MRGRASAEQDARCPPRTKLVDGRVGAPALHLGQLTVQAGGRSQHKKNIHWTVTRATALGHGEVKCLNRQAAKEQESKPRKHQATQSCLSVSRSLGHSGRHAVRLPVGAANNSRTSRAYSSTASSSSALRTRSTGVCAV